MRRLLVTGGAGFIGSNLVRYWVDAHPADSIVIADNFGTGGAPDNVADLTAHSRVQLISADVRDTDEIARLLHDGQTDLVVHLAAETHVDRSIRDPLGFVHNNVLGSASVLEAIRSTRALPEGRRVRIHHVSTDEVFGSLGPDSPALSEDAPYRPRSPYAASKAAADHLIRAYVTTYGIEASISFSCNNYGPFQHPEKLIPRTVWSGLEGRPIPVYGDGSNVRDWLFVADHCRALDLILGLTRAREYNVGADSPLDNLSMVRKICRAIDARVAGSPMLQERFPLCPAARGAPCEELIAFVADRPGHDFRYAIDSVRLTGDTGFKTQWSLDSGIAATVDWYLAHADRLSSRAMTIRC